MSVDHANLTEAQDAWSDHLRDIFLQLEIPPGTVTENLAASVGQYCQQFHPHGVQRADLVLLLARAFCAINDRASAARVLLSTKPHARHADRWIEILSELHHFPELLPYFSQGIIRPGDWAGARPDRMWTLDLGRLVLSESEKHELILYRSLRALLENMFVFWDATQGEGVLGIKGLKTFNIESGKRRHQTFTTAEDLLAYIERLFIRQKGARQWRDVPRLTNLDL